MSARLFVFGIPFINGIRHTTEKIKENLFLKIKKVAGSSTIKHSRNLNTSSKLKL
jgi:hypothetical protein